MSHDRCMLTLFGSPVLSGEAGVIKLRRRKSMALLAYMAMAEQPRTRERVAAMLWPESNSAHALGSLRLALHEINSAANLLEIDRDQILFRHDRCAVDALAFQEAAGALKGLEPGELEGFDADFAAKLRNAATLYTDEFLRGFGLKDAPEFDDWLFFTAESLQTQLGSVLTSLVECTTPIDTTEAIGHAQRLVQLEELNEDHHRFLIDLYVTEGRYSAAIRQFERCREVLARELGDTPSSDLEELYLSLRGRTDEVPEATAVGSGYLRRGGTILRQIPVLTDPRKRRRALIAAVVVVATLAGGGAGYGVWRSRRPPIIPTLIVLPFSYLATGAAEDAPRPMIADTAVRYVESELIKESGLQIRRAGTGDLAGAEFKDVVAFGRREGAQYVLEGTVIDEGEGFTIAATLVSVADGVAMFSDSFSASQLDFAIYLLVIAQEVQTSVYEHVGPELVAYLTSPETLLNPYCETSYLTYPYHLQRDLSEAERSRLFVTIMDNLDDPYNAVGYFDNVDTFWNSALIGMLPPPGAGLILKAALEKGGRELEGPNKELALGIYALVYAGDAGAAAIHFQSAYQQDPTSVGAIRWWTISNALAGNMERALELVDEMAILYELDPTVPILRSMLSYGAGRYEEALAAADLVVSANNQVIGLPLRGMALIQLGRLGEAVTVLEQARTEPAALQHTTAYLAYAYGLLGKTRQARSLLAELTNSENDDPSEHRSASLPAVVFMGLGDVDRALAAVQEAVEAGDPLVWFMRSDPVFAPIAAEVASLIPVADLATLEPQAPISADESI